ncbi:TPA: trigger factor [Candidatus Scatenecus faecavium]|uniref:Trigger factor n=1 Tax=Candidatus Scatenecus faecavium TaxID=2840915 RepID=A0A9D1FV50_9BACT|nr:trigger factor [Candidatus Scatenecus faecavium]
MKFAVEKENDNIYKIDITIPAKDAARAYDEAVKRIAQYVNVDGFRRGKAPRAVVERHVGTERIKQEALESLMPKAIAEAVNESNLDVITQPYITKFDFTVGQDLTAEVKVETRPEVVLGAYKDLKVEVESAEVPEDAFEKALNNVLNQYATQEIVVGRPANDTDIAVIDFEGSVKGEKIAGGDAKNYPLDLGHSNFIPGFAEQIVGKNIGDEFEINVTFPEEYHDEKLKGQPAVFKIKLNEIKERKVPELNDAFAQKVGPFKTVDEFKADIQKYLDTQKENTDRQNSENAVFAKVIEAASVEIPQAMIDREAESLTNDYKQRLQAQGLTWEALEKTQGAESLSESIKEDAKTRIKNSLVIDKIAKEENIKLDPQDLHKKFSQLGAAYGMSQTDLMKQLGKNPEVIASLSQQALNDKVRDFLMEKNSVELVPAKK